MRELDLRVQGIALEPQLATMYAWEICSYGHIINSQQLAMHTYMTDGK